MSNSKAKYKNIAIFICTSIIVVLVLWLIYFPPFRYWSYKKGIMGSSDLREVTITMQERWYPSFGTEFGRGWLMHLFKKNRQGDPFVVISKMDGWSVSHEITVWKVHIDEAKYSDYVKNIDYSIDLPWGTAHVLKRSNPKNHYFVLIKELQLLIITPELSLLDEIQNISENP